MRPGAIQTPAFAWWRTSGRGDSALYTLKVIDGERLARLLERAKEQRYYTVPWPVGHYDSCPTTVD